MTIGLSEIKGQKEAVETIARAIENGKLHHAYLFEGPGGVGKETSALAMAMALNCKSRTLGCGSCSQCRKIVKHCHPDVRLLGCEEGKRIIPIGNIREAEKWIRMKPHEGASRVLIISPADAMNEASSNALLKTLEEPRLGNHIVLVTSMASSLLPTIRSRTQKVRFRALCSDLTSELLIAEGFDTEKASLLSTLSKGSLDKARKMGAEDITDKLSMVKEMILGAAEATPDRILKVASGMRDRDSAIDLLELYITVAEEFLWMSASGRKVKTDDGSLALLKRLVPETTGLEDRMDIGYTTRLIAVINRALNGMKRNNMNPQMAVEMVGLAMRNDDGNIMWSRALR